MEWLSIDIPNLVAGAVLGFLLGLPLYFHERAESRRQTGVSWTKDLRSLEKLLWEAQTTGTEFYEATQQIDLDRYRRVLGPEDFRLVEDTVNAFFAVELTRDQHSAAARAHYASRGVQPPDQHIHNLAMFEQMGESKLPQDARRTLYSREIRALHADPGYVKAERELIRANSRLRELRVELFNRGRRRSAEEYNQLLRREDRAANFRHPLRWARRRFQSWRRSRKR